MRHMREIFLTLWCELAGYCKTTFCYKNIVHEKKRILEKGSTQKKKLYENDGNTFSKAKLLPSKIIWNDNFNDLDSVQPKRNV